MPSPSTRREFLGHAGKFCIGATAASLCCRHLQAAAGPATLCTAVRDGMLRYTGEKDDWSALKLIGAEGVEVDVQEDLTLPALRQVAGKYSLATDAGIEQLRNDAATAGRRITAFCLRNHFEERPELEITLCARVARIAQALGVPAIRLDVVPKQLARPEFLKLAIRSLAKVVAATESTGVAFAVENHGDTTNDPAFLQPLFAGVGSQRLGLTLDTGNFYWFGNPLSKLYELYEAFAPRVFHTHIKSIRYPAESREKQRPIGWKYDDCESAIDRGDIDFARVVAILRKAGYKNDLCIENEFLGKLSPAQTVETLTRELQFLKRLRGQA
jgi:sugar phosphate isomerase/epimerase